MSIPIKIKNKGLSIFPIQTKSFPGFNDIYNTTKKNINVNINRPT